MTETGPSDSEDHPRWNSAPEKSVHPLVKFFRSTFGYRKTSLTLLISLTFVVTLVVNYYANDLDFTVPLPTDSFERQLLQNSWLDLQEIGKYKHPYASSGNDFVHDYLETQITNAVRSKDYIDYDNDLNYTNNAIFGPLVPSAKAITYYESNNLVVRINGTNPKLPALLLSAHYDSVPSSYGITDDGMGIASLLGVLYRYTAKNAAQPSRTIIFNFNNDEEFGLNGARAFLAHPWFKQIHYFLNLEGTGAGGKAFLFRTTDYGVAKEFKNVRYPYANSIFQQGFNNRLVHSETDYKIYKEEGGIRGLDLAFYKPRDIYHTTRDSIKSNNIKSLWHMLSNALDFVEGFDKEIDIDSEHLEDETSSTDFSTYISVFNSFFALPISKVVLVNIVLLVLVPVVSLPFLVVIFQYKKNWELSFLNVIKFPASLGLSILSLNLFVDTAIVSQNRFIVNSSIQLVVFTSLAVFLLVNYLILNGLNWLFKGYKIINHDEKSIVLIETSFVTWLALIYSTVKLSSNKIGDDHTGEFAIAFLLLLQSIGVLFGLIGWSFKEGKNKTTSSDEASQPLLRNQGHSYGSNDQGESTEVEELQEDDASSLSFENKAPVVSKNQGYDWLIQFLLVVPLSSIVVYNLGYLILEALRKSVQESLNSEALIYKFVVLFVVAWGLPILPFIFKFNRIIVTILILGIFFGSFLIQNEPAFDEANPLKLRFLQTIDLNKSPDSYVRVFGRTESPLKSVLEDMPSLKLSGENVTCALTGDGTQICSYKSSLPPRIADSKDLIDITVLKNSSSNNDYQFGLLSGEISIKVPKNRHCDVKFNVSDSTTRLKSINSESPVKTFIIYVDKEDNYSRASGSDLSAEGIPEGFSKDSKGNLVYKLLDGINSVQLNKLDWDKDYHIGFQWLPNLIDTDLYDVESVLIHKLGVQVDCLWAELNPSSKHGEVAESIPAWNELLHYSPNYVSWSNLDKGLVKASKYIEI